jgi:very-short-patch-repair endonuclease
MRSKVITLKRARVLRRAMSSPEVALWMKLRGRHVDTPTFRRQHPIGPYVLDFYCSAARLAVEVDGAGHGEDQQIIHDERRDAWLRTPGLVVYRVTAGAVMHNADEVADSVIRLAMERMGQAS